MHAIRARKPSPPLPKPAQISPVAHEVRGEQLGVGVVEQPTLDQHPRRKPRGEEGAGMEEQPIKYILQLGFAVPRQVRVGGAVARGVGQFSLLTLCSASSCYAGPKLQVTVWQDVMTTLVVRMGLWSGEEGLFISQQVHRTERTNENRTRGSAACWGQLAVAVPAGGRGRQLGSGCYITPPIERLRPRS